MRRGYIILSGAGMILFAIGGSCLDSEGVAFWVAIGMVAVWALLMGGSLLARRRFEARATERRRAECERQVKRDYLFRNWINCGIRPHMGDYHTADD